MDLIRATGLEEERSDKDGSLQRVYQLTGFSDPLYAEAYVHVHRYDIVLGKYKKFNFFLFQWTNVPGFRRFDHQQDQRYPAEC